MPRFLVTGGAGFVGSNIVEALVARGEDVVVFDDLSTGKRENIEPFVSKIRFIEGDICDAGAVASPAIHAPPSPTPAFRSPPTRRGTGASR